jgi:hypothetical protein
VSRLYPSVRLEFVCDRCWQDIFKEFFDARLLSGGFNPGLIELLDHLTIFHQPPGELSWLEIQDTESSQRITFVSDERRAAVNSQQT